MRESTFAEAASFNFLFDGFVEKICLMTCLF